MPFHVYMLVTVSRQMMIYAGDGSAICNLFTILNCKNQIRSHEFALQFSGVLCGPDPCVGNLGIDLRTVSVICLVAIGPGLTIHPVFSCILGSCVVLYHDFGSYPG